MVRKNAEASIKDPTGGSQGKYQHLSFIPPDAQYAPSAIADAVEPSLDHGLCGSWIHLKLLYCRPPQATLRCGAGRQGVGVLDCSHLDIETATLLDDEGPLRRKIPDVQ